MNSYKRHLGLAGLAVIALAATACNQEPTQSISSVSILDDLTQNKQSFSPVSREQLLASLAEGDLISMGESHELGLERQYIALLYSDLAGILKPLPVQCLVETGGSNDGPISLIPLTGDPVMPQFLKICAADRIFDNPVDDYTAKLKTYLPQGRVNTHPAQDIFFHSV